MPTAIELNREHNVFPGCLGRMCARPCEEACRRKEVDAPIGICYLKRVAADYRGETRREIPPPWNGLTAAIIGAGVNGLTAARQLARKGYKVTIFETLPGAGRRDVGRRAGVAPAARRHHGRGRADPRSRHRDPLQHRDRQGHPVQGSGRQLRRGPDLGRLPDRAGARHPGRGAGRRRVRAAVPRGRQPRHRRMSGSASSVVTVGGGFTSMDCVRTRAAHGRRNARS